MSEFSGKCDIYDWFDNERYTDEYIANSEFYIQTSDSKKNHRIHICSRHDLIPYYPYLVGLGYGNKNGYSKIFISGTSFVDKEEEEFLQRKLNAVLLEWRRCKRKKQTFDEEEVYKNITIFNDAILKEIIHHVAVDGNKADISDIHDAMHEHYRARLADEMMKNGYSREQSLTWSFNESIFSFSNAEKRYLQIQEGR